MSFSFSLPSIVALPSASLAQEVPPGQCPEEWYCRHPEVLSAFYRKIQALGPALLLAPTAGANAACLAEFGLEDAGLNLRLMQQAKEAAAPLGLPVGGMLGPTGLFVPPLGEADFDDVYELYRQQVHELVKAGADFLYLSGHHCLSDLRAAMLAAKRKKLPVLASLTVDSSGRLALELLPGEDDADLVLEETPDVTFADIGGLDEQIERIRDAVQLPFLHRELFERYNLNPPKGVLLYGPPGNGKTLIAKAVAHMLAEGTESGGVFLSVKGPELLNKFVGESERLIRLIFARARERAASGRPVIVFIDEMDSLLRTRGSGVSSDVETTIVPQFLAELDGVEQLDNVMVIGASNRVDMIDPAVLRPGRLDVKIRVDRPGPRQADDIIRHYLTDDLPLEQGVDAHALARVLVGDIYAQDEHRHVCDVCDEHGQWRAIHMSDVVSGAMLKNIVDRAKTRAVKASIETGAAAALSVDMLAMAAQEEFRESMDAILDADPVQWSRIAGFESGSVTRIRPAGDARTA